MIDFAMCKETPQSIPGEYKSVTKEAEKGSTVLSLGKILSVGRSHDGGQAIQHNWDCERLKEIR